MKVFISFDSLDSQLAYYLKQILEDKNISCYLFDSKPKYTLSIKEKITNEINNSTALVTILTENNKSPSVHQEIGYSIAMNIPVIVMMEENADDGILAHDREKEIFTRDDFTSSCHRVREYLQNEIPTVNTTGDSITFLEKRKLIQTDTDGFGTGGKAKKLNNPRIRANCVNDSAVLFSACPTKLLSDILVKSESYREWLKQFSSISVDGYPVRFLGSTEKIELNGVTYYHGDRNSYSQYSEIWTNGFVEQGFAAPLIYSGKLEPMPVTCLNSCWVAGAFHAFLVFCKKHYKFHRYAGELTVLLSIRGADRLTLIGFGGKDVNNNAWPEPDRIHWHGPIPMTEERNISIPKKIKIQDLSGEYISQLAHRFADNIANAYGLDTALCYNHDDMINKDILTFYRF